MTNSGSLTNGTVTCRQTDRQTVRQTDRQRMIEAARNKGKPFIDSSKDKYYGIR